MEHRPHRPYLRPAVEEEFLMTGNASSPMRQVARIPGTKNKLTGRRRAFIGIYWADGTFVRPGLYVWLVNRHWRVLPVPKRRYP